MQRNVRSKNAARGTNSRKIQQNLFDLLPKRGRKPLKPHDHFGGKYLKNYNPKSQRPMDSKKALHVVLKVSKATEKKLLEKDSKLLKSKDFEESIWDIIRIHANNKGIKIYEFANAGNHLHLLIRAKQREDYSAFIRIITGLIARLVGKKERGSGLNNQLNGLCTKFRNKYKIIQNDHLNSKRISNIKPKLSRELDKNEQESLIDSKRAAQTSEFKKKIKQKFWDGRPFSRIVSFAKKEFQAVKTYLLRNTLEAIGWMPYVPRSKQLPGEWGTWLVGGSG